MPELFDDLSRILASRMPRRDAFRLFFGAVAGTYLTLLWPRNGEADVQRICQLNPGGCRGVDADDCGGNCCCTHAGDTCCGKFGEGTPCCSDTQVRCFNTARTKCNCCDKAGNCCNGDCCSPENCCGQGATQRCCTACEDCKDGKCVPKAVTPCTGRADGKTKCCPKTGGGVYCCRPEQCCVGSKNACGDKTATRDSRISVFRANGTQQVQITVTDENGIGTITVKESRNATVRIPPFVPGTRNVTVTATKIDMNERAFVQLEVCPPETCACEGCCGIIDPSLAQLDIPEGTNEARERFTGIPENEHFVTIQNGDSGLRRVQLVVNGRTFPPRWMRDNDVKTIDIAPAMKASGNVVTVVANGRPGSSALVLVSDLPAWPKRLSRLPPIEWEPGAEPGINLHWGN